MRRRTEKPGERYILANENVNVQGYFALLEEITGVSAPKIKIPYIFAYTTAFLLERVLGLGFPNYSTLDIDSIKLSRFNWHADNSKAVRDLGFTVTPIEQTIQKTVEWFQGKRLSEVKKGIKWRETVSEDFSGLPLGGSPTPRSGSYS